MVGPSSSHTAGAVRIGFVAQKLLGEPVKRARIGLYGSFLATGTGHGTQKALIAGLLGMVPDDMRIPDSFHLAEEKGIEFSFEEANLKEAHPNSAELELEGISGRSLTVVGESLGGSRINIAKVDGIEANFSGSYPTLVVHNDDQPGHVADVTAMLAHKSINIATMQLYRAARGGIGFTKAAANYAASIYAGELAAKKGYSQVLWLDAVERKYIEEVGAMNIFFVIDGKLVTPPLRGSILPGITRDSVIKLARSLGYEVEERLISVDEVMETAKNGHMSESFGSGTAAVISPVGAFALDGNEVQVGDGGIGPVAQKLYDTLTGIQYGRVHDEFGWSMKVDI